MIGIYFSGTGNTKFCLGKFLTYYGSGTTAFSIEGAAKWKVYNVLSMRKLLSKTGNHIVGKERV